MSMHLRKAIRAVHLVDSFKTRQDFFEFYVSRHLSARMVLRFYSLIRGTWLSALMFTCFGMRYLFKQSFRRSHEYKLLSPIDYINEKRAILDLLHRANDDLLPAPNAEGMLRLSAALKNFRRNAELVYRFCRFFRRYEKMGTFLSCCRVSETLWLYVCAGDELEVQQVNAAFVATNYSPTACALVAQARNHGLPSVYTFHAIIPHDTIMPPLEVDLAFLYSELAIEAFQVYGGVRCGRIHFTGLPGESCPMNIVPRFEHVKSVGIFLTADIVPGAFPNLVAFLNDIPHIETILVRPHPLKSANPDMGFLANYPKVRVDGTGRAFEAAKQNQLVIAGSSSVHIEVLKSGTPTLFWDGFDSLGPDYYRFLREGICYELKSLQAINWAEVQTFYNADWVARFRRIDCSYLNDREVLNQEIRQALTQLSERERKDPQPILDSAAA